MDQHWTSVPTTIIYFVFSASRSADLDDNETPATAPGNKDSSTAPVALRRSDPLREVKLNRRRSPIVGAPPAAQAFGVELKRVTKPEGQLV